MDSGTSRGGGQDALHNSVNWMKLQARKRRRDGMFQVGQQVLLSTRRMRKQMSRGSKPVVSNLLSRYIWPS